MPTSRPAPPASSDTTGLENQNVTGPAPIDDNDIESEIPPDQEKPGLEDRNVTAPAPSKPSPL